MARLYYEKAKTQPEFTEGENGKSAGSDYLEKLAKLIPSEVIAGFLTIFGFIPLIKNVQIQSYFYWADFFLCLILTPIYLYSQAEKDKPKRNHLIVSTIAFLIWAYVTTGSTLVPNYHDPAIASILLVVFSLVSALIPLNK